VADPGTFPKYARNTDSDVSLISSSSVGTRGAGWQLLYTSKTMIYIFKEKILNIIDYLIDYTLPIISDNRLWKISDFPSLLIAFCPLSVRPPGVWRLSVRLFSSPELKAQVSYRIFRMIGRYFFSLICQARPILQMRLIYCFIKIRDLKITCHWIQIWKMMQITLKIHSKSISTNITWTRCGL
jgi:hypothetical protein